MNNITQCLVISNSINPRLLITLAIKLHLTKYLIPADCSLFDLWHKYGLDKNHDLSIRLEVLHQWISILHGKDIDLDAIVMKMRAERSVAYQAVSKAGGCLLQGDIIDSLLRYELDLSG